MASFFSDVWDFIIWLFPWVLIGVGTGSYYSYFETSLGNKNKAREYLFISTAIGVVAGIVIPIYLQTSSYWTAPLVFWSGFLILSAVVMYTGGDFWEGIFGLGMASITQYILSFYNEANSNLLTLLRFVFLFLIFFTGIKFAQFLNNITKQKTKKTSSKSHKSEVDDAEISQMTEVEEAPTPREFNSDRIDKGKTGVEHGNKWENTSKIILSVLGILITLSQLVNQILDILNKVP